jgi:hypothetical protein
MLAGPLHPDQVRWKVCASGVSDRKPWARILPYTTADAMRERLDATVGIGGWNSTIEIITAGPQPGVKCRIELDFAGRWIHREDVAPFTEQDPLKGGASSAFKRAAAALGVAAYLRHVEPVSAEVTKDGDHLYVHRDPETGSERTFRWNLPHDIWTRMLSDYVNAVDDVRAMQKRMELMAGTEKVLA